MSGTHPSPAPRTATGTVKRVAKLGCLSIIGVFVLLTVLGIILNLTGYEPESSTAAPGQSTTATESPSTKATVKATVAQDAEPTVEPTTPAPENTPAPTAEATATTAGDRTEEFMAATRQPWRAKVMSVVQDEIGHVVVETTIVDPRGDDGSVEAQQAVAVCEVVEAMTDGKSGIRVQEADGTTFAVKRVQPSETSCEEV